MFSNKSLQLINTSKKQFFVFGTTLVWIFLLILIVSEAFNTRDRDIERAQVQTENISKLLEKELLSVFKLIDHSLFHIRDQYLLNLKKSHLENLNSLLVEEKNRIPNLLSFKLIDQQGNLFADNLPIKKQVNYNDRDYFQNFIKNQTDHLFISDPLMSRTSNTWVIVLARPIFDAKKRFLGLVIGTIETDYFQKMISQVNIGKDGLISISNQNDLHLARIPISKELVGSKILIGPFVSGFKEAQISFTDINFQSPIDHKRRIGGALFNSHYNFIVKVAYSTDELLLGWKKRAIIILSVFFIIVIGFYIFLYRFLISLMEIEIREQHSLQTAKLASLGEMSSAIAHEINNPLAAIAGQVHLLKRLISSSDPDYILKSNEYLEKINNNVKRITKIIFGLKSFSRDSFNDPLKIVSLKSILDESLSLCEERLKNNAITVALNTFSNIEIECKEIQLEQVFVNLINNSFDAIKDKDEKWIKITVTELDSTVEIIFQDSGLGLPQEIIDRVMEPFFTTKVNGQGTGLGLSISAGIIKNHQGKFFIDKSNKHTTFCITLPKKITS